jgi:hypothetical protein
LLTASSAANLACSFAPYPAGKVAKLVKDVEEGKALIAEGK